jgi:hypothetical protein
MRPPLVLLDPFADSTTIPTAASNIASPPNNNIAYNVFQFARIQVH